MMRPIASPIWGSQGLVERPGWGLDDAIERDELVYRDRAHRHHLLPGRSRTVRETRIGHSVQLAVSGKERAWTPACPRSPGCITARLRHNSRPFQARHRAQAFQPEPTCGLPARSRYGTWSLG